MRSLVALLCLITLPVAVARAQQSSMEDQLRAALRSATTQLRDLQDQQAESQAKETELTRQNEVLRQQVAALTQQQAGSGAGGKAQPDRAALDQAAAEYNRKLAAQNETIGQLNETLDKWKSAYDQAATTARAKEAERAQLASRVDGATQAATSCVAKNAALFKIGNEILDRYQHMDLGDVLGSREPFTGIERVKLQNIAQDYHGKLLDQKVAQ
jgi:chromosome segregation ATPase